MLTRTWNRFRAWCRKHAFAISLVSLVMLLLIVYLHRLIFIPVHSGEVGVRWSRFFGGTQVSEVYGEGLQVIFPWDHMHKYTIRLQEESKTFNVLVKDGLEIEVDVTVRFQVVAENVGYLHKYVGPNYIQTLLLPEVESHAREEMARYRSEELYSTSRAQLRRAIHRKMQGEIDNRYSSEAGPRTFIYVEDLLIRGIVLPIGVREAISDKIEHEQLMLEYDYVIAKEKKEKERKRIEAEGIRIFQDIVADGISEPYLRWKGIDATLRLARSNNSKVVVIGAGEAGLPIILGNLGGDGAPSTGSASAASGSSGSDVRADLVGEETVPTGSFSGSVEPDTVSGLGDITQSAELPSRTAVPPEPGAETDLEALRPEDTELEETLGWRSLWASLQERFEEENRQDR